jgi:serine/threonine protein kinase
MKEIKISHLNIAHTMEFWPTIGGYGLLLLPEADGNLKTFLENLEQSLTMAVRPSGIAALKQWVLCLSDALFYLHRVGFCHTAIQPANILIKGETILLTDFGVVGEDPVTLSGVPLPRTMPIGTEAIRYGALEEKHGKHSDVFSLGCVLLEMVTLMVLRSPQDMSKRLFSSCSTAYYQNPAPILRWVQELMVAARDMAIHPPIDKNFPSFCLMVLLMLEPDLQTRLTSEDVLMGLVSLSGKWISGINGSHLSDVPCDISEVLNDDIVCFGAWILTFSHFTAQNFAPLSSEGSLKYAKVITVR